MSADLICLKLFQIEQILNEYSGKRYHIIQNVNDRYDIIKVKENFKKKMLLENATKEEAYEWLKQKLRVELRE